MIKKYWQLTKKNILQITILIFSSLILYEYFNPLLQNILTIKIVGFILENRTLNIITLWVPVTLLGWTIYYNREKMYYLISWINLIIIFFTSVKIYFNLKESLFMTIIKEHINLYIAYPVLIAITLYIIDTFLNKLQKRDFNGFNNILDDKPITSKDPNFRNDLDYIIQTTKIALENSVDESISLAITGEWGSGKTSFINLLKSKLTKKFILIDFFPWRYEDPNGIIKGFFELLYTNLPYDFHLRKNIKRYLKDITSSLTPINHIYFGISNNLSDNNEIYGKIESELNKINKKIVFFIDDIDRLDKEEILSILKIIRGCAGFKNIKFISSMDINYVIKTLSNDYDEGERFLRKFIDFERNIPILSNQNKINILFEIIDKKNIDEKTVKIILTEKKFIETQNILSILSNIRDIKRFLTTVSMKLLLQENIEKLLNSVTKIDVKGFQYINKIKLSNQNIICISLIISKLHINYGDEQLSDVFNSLEAYRANKIDDINESYKNLFNNKKIYKIFKLAFNISNDIESNIILSKENFHIYFDKLELTEYSMIRIICLNEIDYFLKNLTEEDTISDFINTISSEEFNFIKDDKVNCLLKHLNNNPTYEKKNLYLKFLDNLQDVDQSWIPYNIYKYYVDENKSFRNIIEDENISGKFKLCIVFTLLNNTLEQKRKNMDLLKSSTEIFMFLKYYVEHYFKYDDFHSYIKIRINDVPYSSPFLIFIYIKNTFNINLTDNAVFSTFDIDRLSEDSNWLDNFTKDINLHNNNTNKEYTKLHRIISEKYL